MRAVGHRAVRVDLSTVTSIGDACARVARAYADLPTDPQQTFQRLLQRFGRRSGRRA
jgi:hypothetical protein